MNLNAKVEFEQIVQKLAVSTKPLRDRLREEAAPALVFMQESHLPDEHKDEFRWIKEAVLAHDLKTNDPGSLISRIVSLSYRLNISN